MAKNSFASLKKNSADPVVADEPAAITPPQAPTVVSPAPTPAPVVAAPDPSPPPAAPTSASRQTAKRQPRGRTSSTTKPSEAPGSTLRADHAELMMLPYEDYEPLDARLHPDQIDALETTARQLQRRKKRSQAGGPRITKNTLLRFAVAELLDRSPDEIADMLGF